MIRKDFKYKKIKNFLTKDELELFTKYMIIRHKWNINNFDFKQDQWDTCFYTDPLSESLLLTKQQLVEKETGIELFPTYSFTRMYTFASNLKEHSDRPACEISVTVMLGSDGTPWPIYMEDTPILLEPGDACIYLGCDLKHRRDEFEGDWHSQVFLHYVDKKGPNAKEKFDGRPFII